MGITELELKQALEREAALSQAQLASVCTQANAQAAEWQTRLESICTQVNSIFERHRQALEYLLTTSTANRVQPTGSLAELQRDVAALMAHPPAAPSVHVTIPERNFTLNIAPELSMPNSVTEVERDAKGRITRSRTSEASGA